MRGLVAEEGNLAVVEFGGPGPRLTKKQLATALGRTTRFVEYRMAEGMPYSTDRRGRRRFSLAECRSWLSAHEEAS